MACLEAAGVDTTQPLPSSPRAAIQRCLRTGEKTTEILPLWLAQWVMASIPEIEPLVASAKLILLG